MYTPQQELRALRHGILHRYRPVNSIERLERELLSIKRRSLWLYDLTNQNDKSECTPIVYFGGSKRDRYRYFKSEFKQSFPDADMDKLDKMARKASRNPVIPNQKSVYRNWGVCCFSTDGNNLRMWSEYAGGGNGIVITYLADSSVSLGNAGRVQYCDEKIYLDLLKMNNEDMFKIFTTKELKWSYENEYRIVERLSEPNSGNEFHLWRHKDCCGDDWQ